MMSSQADYAAAQKATQSAQEKITNARNAAKKVAEDKAKVNQLNESISAITRVQINPATEELKIAEKLLNNAKDAYTAYYNAHHTEPGYPSGTDLITLNSLSSIIAAQTAVVNSSKKKINDFNATITAIKKQIADLIPSTDAAKQKLKSKGGSGSGSGTGPAPKGESKAFSKDHKYNAPMVPSAYFGVESIQSDVLENNHVDPGNWGNASQAWQGVNGGRGTIQMDKKFIEGVKLSDTSRKFDLQKYGFKFLYNPTTVSMAWGLMSYMDPTYESTGQDPFQVVSAGMLSSTVQFELMLNRIADFNYINENGLRGAVSAANLRENRIPEVKSPYPQSVTAEELKDIYNKGTMYDLEYFFKTVNGPDGTFVSALNGSTSDRAWLRPSIVELHLGNSMRYRVRISQFAVNHIMFNSRMVPILSTVSITCSRFNDGPTAAAASSTGTYTASGASYGANNAALYQPGGTKLP